MPDIDPQVLALFKQPTSAATSAGIDPSVVKMFNQSGTMAPTEERQLESDVAEKRAGKETHGLTKQITKLPYQATDVEDMAKEEKQQVPRAVSKTREALSEPEVTLPITEQESGKPTPPPVAEEQYVTASSRLPKTAVPLSIPRPTRNAAIYMGPPGPGMAIPGQENDPFIGERVYAQSGRYQGHKDYAGALPYVIGGPDATPLVLVPEDVLGRDGEGQLETQDLLQRARKAAPWLAPADLAKVQTWAENLKAQVEARQTNTLYKSVGTPFLETAFRQLERPGRAYLGGLKGLAEGAWSSPENASPIENAGVAFSGVKGAAKEFFNQDIYREQSQIAKEAVTSAMGGPAQRAGIEKESPEAELVAGVTEKALPFVDPGMLPQMSVARTAKMVSETANLIPGVKALRKAATARLLSNPAIRETAASFTHVPGAGAEAQQIVAESLAGAGSEIAFTTKKGEAAGLRKLSLKDGEDLLYAADYAATSNVPLMGRDLFPNQPNLIQAWDFLQEEFTAQHRIEQAYGVTSNTIQSYIPHILREVKGFPIMGKPGALTAGKKGFQKARDLPFIPEKHLTDIGQIYMARKIAGIKAVAREKMLQRAASEFGFDAQTIRGTADLAPESRAAKLREAGLLPQMPGSPYEESTRQLALEGFSRLLKSEQPRGALTTVYDSTMALFKAAVTIGRPRFYSQKFAGDISILIAAGVDPVSGTARAIKMNQYVEALADLAGKGKSIPAKLANYKVGNFTLQQLFNVEREYGLGRGMFGSSQELASARGAVGRTKQVVGGTMREGRAVIDAADVTARRAMFLDLVSQGKAPRDALMEARVAFVDYSNLTEFERTYARRIVPFYTFLRGQIEANGRMLAQRPAAFMTGEKFRRQWNQQEAEASKIDRTFLPRYFREKFGFQMPGGSPEMAKYLAVSLPIEELNRLSFVVNFAKGDISGGLKEIANQFAEVASPIAGVMAAGTGAPTGTVGVYRPGEGPGTEPGQETKIGPATAKVLNLLELISGKRLTDKELRNAWGDETEDVADKFVAYLTSRVPLLHDIDTAWETATAVKQGTSETVSSPRASTTPTQRGAALFTPVTEHIFRPETERLKMQQQYTKPAVEESKRRLSSAKRRLPFPQREQQEAE